MDWWTVVLLTLPTFILLLNTYHKFNYVVKFVYLYVSYIVSVFGNFPTGKITLKFIGTVADY